MTMFKEKTFWFSTLGILILGMLSGVFALNARTYYGETLVLPSVAPPG